MWWIAQVWALEPVDNTQPLEAEIHREIRVDFLKDKLDAVYEEMEMHQEFSQHDAEILKALSIAIDSRESTAARVAAIQRLTEFNATVALPFFWEMMVGDGLVEQEIIASLPKYMTDATPEVTVHCEAILRKALYLSETKPSNITIAIGNQSLWGDLNGERYIVASMAQRALSVSSQLKDPMIAQLLFLYVQDASIPVVLREEALQILQNGYADWMSGRETPIIRAASNRLANQIYAVSAGVTGSVLLGSVGVWGQNDTSEVIGYYGGALLGATSGWLISQQEHPTLSQAALMASSTGWGLGLGQMGAYGLDVQPEYAALFRTVGVMAGTGYGHWARNRQMSLSDVLEADFMGYYGSQVALGLTDVLADQSLLQYPQYEEYFPDRPLEWDSPEAQQYQADYDAAYVDFEERRDKHDRQKAIGAAVGASIGLGVSHVLMPEWKPTTKSVLFAGVWAGQTAIATDNLLSGLEVDYPQGKVRLSAHATMAGALVYDHFKPTTYDQSIFSAYGAGVGYLLGYGINDLMEGDYLTGNRNASLESMFGTLGGTLLGNQMGFTVSDWVSTGVGMGISGWHFGSIASIAQENEWLTSQQASGLVATGLGATALGLLGTGHSFDISSSDAIFLGSAAAWGTYYGALTPLMLGVDSSMTSSEKLLTTLLTSDAFLAVGTTALLRNRLESEQTAIPQVLGLAGATLGSLGAFLFTDSSQVVSGAALVGATVGLGSGVLLENSAVTASLHLPKWKRPRFVQQPLHIQASPYQAESGDMGIYVGISN